MVAEEKVPDTVKLYNVNDGIKGRNNGGPWLDEEQNKQQEDRAAYAEGRDPDYDNIQGGAGLQLVTEAELIKVHANTLNNLQGGDAKVEAPVYGEIENPAKAAIEADKAQAEETLNRAKSEQEANEVKPASKSVFTDKDKK